MADHNDLWKFPRTKHLYDAGGGGVTRDDLLMTKKEAKDFINNKLLSVEEKVDGANIGIGITKDYRFQVQNRSHFINSKTHKQFNQLDSWLEENSRSLFNILQPCKTILFGEWLAVKHSIHYTNLPSLFLAFDVFDVEKRSFLSRETRDNVLKDSGIHTVPLITEKQFKNKEEVLQLLETKSKLYNGPVEGIYLRYNDQSTGEEGIQELLKRAKVVRADFIQNIGDTWTKQKFTKNIVDYANFD